MRPLIQHEFADGLKWVREILNLHSEHFLKLAVYASKSSFIGHIKREKSRMLDSDTRTGSSNWKLEAVLHHSIKSNAYVGSVQSH